MGGAKNFRSYPPPSGKNRPVERGRATIDPPLVSPRIWATSKLFFEKSKKIFHIFLVINEKHLQNLGIVDFFEIFSAPPPLHFLNGFRQL